MFENHSKRIVLDEDDFRGLVQGNVIENEGVEIILSDIGFNRVQD